MCGVTGNLFNTVRGNSSTDNYLSYLVAKTLRCNDGNFIADSLVGLEVQGELWVVSFDNDLCGLLNGLRSDSTHDCG